MSCFQKFSMFIKYTKMSTMSDNSILLSKILQKCRKYFKICKMFKVPPLNNRFKSKGRQCERNCKEKGRILAFYPLYSATAG